MANRLLANCHGVTSRVLLVKLDNPEARDWYARAAVAGGWSRNVLLNQIKGRAHDRAGAAPSNFDLTLAGEDSELAARIVKDPYVLDFLGLSGRVAERLAKPGWLRLSKPPSMWMAGR